MFVISEQFERLREVPHVFYTGLNTNNFPEQVIHMKEENISPVVRQN
jgi:hypothetical protein